MTYNFLQLQACEGPGNDVTAAGDRSKHSQRLRQWSRHVYLVYLFQNLKMKGRSIAKLCGSYELTDWQMVIWDSQILVKQRTKLTRGSNSPILVCQASHDANGIKKFHSSASRLTHKVNLSSTVTSYCGLSRSQQGDNYIRAARKLESTLPSFYFTSKRPQHLTDSCDVHANF